MCTVDQQKQSQKATISHETESCVYMVHGQLRRILWGEDQTHVLKISKQIQETV